MTTTPRDLLNAAIERMIDKRFHNESLMSPEEHGAKLDRRIDALRRAYRGDNVVGIGRRQNEFNRNIGFMLAGSCLILMSAGLLIWMGFL